MICVWFTTLKVMNLISLYFKHQFQLQYSLIKSSKCKLQLKSKYSAKLMSLQVQSFNIHLYRRVLTNSNVISRFLWFIAVQGSYVQTLLLFATLFRHSVLPFCLRNGHSDLPLCFEKFSPSKYSKIFVHDIAVSAIQFIYNFFCNSTIFLAFCHSVSDKMKCTFPSSHK